jgi:hypothetical protein
MLQFNRKTKNFKMMILFRKLFVGNLDETDNLMNTCSVNLNYKLLKTLQVDLT